jgi:MFS family permease
MLFFWGPVSGKLCDDFGPRIPILIGSFLHVFGIMMVSISTKYYQIFLAQSICSSIGCSMLFYASVSATASWFLRHRALAFGIMISGSSLGGIILPIMVDNLIPKLGFGWTIRTLAFVFLALLIFGNLTIRSRLKPVRRPLILMDFLTPFTEGAFLLLSISAFFIYLGGFLPFNFIIVQAKSAGMSTRLSGYLVPIINAAS